MEICCTHSRQSSATSSTANRYFKNTIRPGSIVISDSQRSYHQLMDALNIKWVKIPSGEKSKMDIL